MEGFYSSHATREAAAAAALVTRPVRLGLATVNGIWPFATHWAVQVDDTWFEVAGASKVGTAWSKCPPPIPPVSMPPQHGSGRCGSPRDRPAAPASELAVNPRGRLGYY